MLEGIRGIHRNCWSPDWKVIMNFDIDAVGGIVKMKQEKTLRVKVTKPFTRKPIKPRQAHKIATRYTRKVKHGFGDTE